MLEVGLDLLFQHRALLLVFRIGLDRDLDRVATIRSRPRPAFLLQ